jgi:signal peptidase I
MRRLLVIAVIALAGCAKAPRLDPEIRTYPTVLEAWTHAQADVINTGAALYIVANTGSMEPTLTTEDLLIVVREPYESLQAGRVVTFKADWRPAPITHRLTIKRDGVWGTSGDANHWSDPGWMDEKQYIGVVKRVYRVKK